MAEILILWGGFGRWIEDAKLEFDPAIAFCLACWEREQRDGIRSSADTAKTLETNPNSARSDLVIGALDLFDTILVRTTNSDYRISLLDPNTGRAMIEGGQYFTEPCEVLLLGSVLHDHLLKPGSIVNGYRLQMWVDEKTLTLLRQSNQSVSNRKFPRNQLRRSEERCSMVRIWMIEFGPHSNVRPTADQ